MDLGCIHRDCDRSEACCCKYIDEMCLVKSSACLEKQTDYYRLEQKKGENCGMRRSVNVLCSSHYSVRVNKPKS